MKLTFTVKKFLEYCMCIYIILFIRSMVHEQLSEKENKHPDKCNDTISYSITPQLIIQHHPYLVLANILNHLEHQSNP